MENSVQLLETFGSDLTVVNAARVSFAKESKELDDRDAKLIRYLAKHNHISPFFHPQIRFRIKMPIFVAREWFRHTVGFSRNEVSRRYVDSEPECWIPEPDQIRARDPKAKQGSRPDPVKDSEAAHRIMSNTINDSLDAYDRLLSHGVAPEIARAVLPQSMMTEFIETGSLAAYARLCGLRLDPSAQREIQEYARYISDLLEKAFPISWKALSEKFRDDATATLSAPTPAPTTTLQDSVQTPPSIPVPSSTPQSTPPPHQPLFGPDDHLRYWGC